MIDEISLLLQKRIVTKVATLKQISDILKKTEQSQRVLEEASEGFQIIREDEEMCIRDSIRPQVWVRALVYVQHSHDIWMIDLLGCFDLVKQGSS